MALVATAASFLAMMSVASLSEDKPIE